MAVTAGDIAFVGMSASAPDRFAILVLRPIAAGDSFFLTDGGITGAGGAGSTFFRSTEGFLQYTAPVGGIAAGSVLVFLGGEGGAPSVSRNGGGAAGTVTALANSDSNTVSFSLLTSGDQITAYTVPSGTHLTGTPTLIAFIDIANNPYTTSTTSDVPSIPGGQVLDFGLAQNVIFTDGANVATQTIAALSNIANFSAQNGTAYDYSGLASASANTAPTLTGFGPSVAYTEQAAAVFLDSDVTFADAEGNFTAGTLVVSGVAAGDTVAVVNQGTSAGQVGVSGATLSFGGTAIGTIAGGVAANLTITFNASATSAAVDAVIQRLSYANSSDTPPASRALTVTVTDAGGLSVAGGITVNIAAVNDAPVFTAGASTNITRVSTTSAGAQATGGESTGPVFSPDGTRIAFESAASNLVASDTNAVIDIFVKDLATGAITRVSTTGAGAQATGGNSFLPVFSPDGTMVAFQSAASNLVAGDTNGENDVFVKNLTTGAITRVSTTSAGAQATGGGSSAPVFSPDGTKLAFFSAANNLVAGDTNDETDIFIKDLTTGAVTRVSTTSAGAQATGGSSFDAAFSPDGTELAFQSSADNLVADDTNNVADIFVKDLTTGAITRISTTSAGAEATGGVLTRRPVFSPDGTSVAFESTSGDLVADDTNAQSDIFVKVLMTGVITRVSTTSAGAESTGQSFAPVFSPDGTRVAFDSSGSDLVAGDTNGTSDLFVKDLTTGAIIRVSTTSAGAQATGGSSFAPIFSPDGTRLVFFSQATNLVASDTNGVDDVFIKDLDLNPTYTENGAPVLIARSVTLTDADSASYTGGTLTAAITGAGAGDTIGFPTSGNVAVAAAVAGAVTVGGVQIGTVTALTTTSATITFNTNATDAAVIALTQAATYRSTSEDPGSGTATITFTLVDGGGTAGGGADTASFTRTVTVVPVDDAPVAVANSFSVPSNAIATLTLEANDTDVDGGPINVIAINGVTPVIGTLIQLPSGAQVRLNGNGSFTYIPTGPFNRLISEETAAATGAVNTQASDSFTYTLNGGSTATVSVTVTGVDGPGDRLEGNAGNNTITGRTGNDVFFINQGGSDTVTTNGGSDTIFAGTTLDSSDRITGTAGAGIDNQVVIQGNYTATLTGPVLTNIQTLAIQPGNDARWGDASGALYSYNITLADSANVAAGATLTVNANRLRVGENLVFNGAAETDGSFRFYAASGNDTLIGGGQADEFYGRLGADTLTGNGGNDTFFYRSAAESTQASRDTITDFTSGDRIDLSAIDANTLNAVGLNDAFTFIGAAAFSGGGITGAGQLRAVNTAGANWRIDGDIDGDGTADFSLIVMTTGGHAMVATDFIL